MTVTTALTYSTGTASESDVYLHLMRCKDAFIPSLDSRIDIGAYAKKISLNAMTFEAWQANSLVGLVATYFNRDQNLAFITNVSIDNGYKGLGVAALLMTRCIHYAEENNYHEIQLEVGENNLPAINFYKKFSFTQIDSKKNHLKMSFIIK